MKVICDECKRVFDLTNENDAGEFSYGHDCEVEWEWGMSKPTTPDAQRLEYLRTQIDNETISWNELVELQGLSDKIDSSDVVLLEWAGVPEND